MADERTRSTRTFRVAKMAELAGWKRMEDLPEDVWIRIIRWARIGIANRGRCGAQTRTELTARSSLSAEDCARMECTCKSIKKALDIDVMWEKFLARDYLLEEPRFPTKETELSVSRKSPRNVYLAWKHEFSKYGALTARALKCWKRIETWTKREIEEVYASLCPGATESELDLTEQDLGHPLPPALRVVYRLHNGQDLLYDRMVDQRRFVGGSRREAHPSLFHGVFGGYAFYDQMVNVRFFSLDRMVRWTELCKAQGIVPVDSSCVVFAASFNFQKIFVAHCELGLVFVSHSSRQTLSQAVPRGEDAEDGFLRWLEYFSDQMQNGTFSVKSFDGSTGSLGISLYPVSGPEYHVRVTEGVQCEASCVYVPELSQTNHHFFSYSIRFRLLSLEEQEEKCGTAHEAVQLQDRRWNILDMHGERVDQVSGDGVVGQYPYLKAGGPPYEYQSCTSVEEGPGFMEGSFGFVVGSISTPRGSRIEVECPRFELDRPDYII